MKELAEWRELDEAVGIAQDSLRPICPKYIVKSPEILSYVAPNLSCSPTF